MTKTKNDQDVLTPDTFFHGKITVKQKESGYRYSIDSVLLAWHCRPRPGNRIIDLGTGCGIIPLILLYRHPAITIQGIEIQKDLADIARLNIRENGYENRADIIWQDMSTLKGKSVNPPVDIIVSNPPYRKADSGRINPNQECAVARHEIKITLEGVIQTARKLLSTGGRLITINTADRLTDLITCMRNTGIEPKFARMIHSKQKSEARMVLIEGTMRGRPGMKIAPPLVIYNNDGSYTNEVEKMFLP